MQASAKDAVNPVTATWNLILTAKLSAEATLTAGLPAEFDVFHRYARSLAFDDLPDYDGLRRLLRGLGRRIGACYGDVLEGEEGVDESERLIDGDDSGLPDKEELRVWDFDWSVGTVGRQRRGSVKSGDSGKTKGGRHCEACEARRARRAASEGEFLR